MRLKLDENLPRSAVDLIRNHGHDVHALLDQVAAGLPDARVAELVRVETRVLVTLDLDFADIRTYPPEEYSGIVVLRLRRTSSDAVLALLERLMIAVGDGDLSGQLWIVEGDRIRIRGESV